MKIVEIQPGEGGEDAELFSDDLTTAIHKWALQKGLTVQAAGDHIFTVDGRKEYV